MAAGNEVMLVGNCTRDVELRFTPSGQAVASFGLAVNRRWQDRQTQEWNEETSFFDCVAWAGLAENAAQSIEKGCRVVVTGRLDQQTWQTAEGDNRSKVQIVADEIAPSLKWATCQVTKVQRDDTTGGARSAPTQTRPTATARPTRPTVLGGAYDEEEPF